MPLDGSNDGEWRNDLLRKSELAAAQKQIESLYRAAVGEFTRDRVLTFIHPLLGEKCVRVIQELIGDSILPSNAIQKYGEHGRDWQYWSTFHNPHRSSLEITAALLPGLLEVGDALAPEILDQARKLVTKKVRKLHRRKESRGFTFDFLREEQTLSDDLKSGYSHLHGCYSVPHRSTKDERQEFESELRNVFEEVHEDLEAAYPGHFTAGVAYLHFDRLRSREAWRRYLCKPVSIPENTTPEAFRWFWQCRSGRDQFQRFSRFRRWTTTLREDGDRIKEDENGRLSRVPVEHREAPPADEPKPRAGQYLCRHPSALIMSDWIPPHRRREDRNLRLRFRDAAGLREMNKARSEAIKRWEQKQGRKFTEASYLEEEAERIWQHATDPELGSYYSLSSDLIADLRSVLERQGIITSSDPSPMSQEDRWPVIASAEEVADEQVEGWHDPRPAPLQLAPGDPPPF